MISTPISVSAEKKSILVVDDSSVLCCAYRQMLRAWGFEVDVAEDGLVGLEYLRSTSYHLVISDYEMPRCNGIDFLQKFRSEIDTDAETPFILVTGTPMNQLSGRLDGFARTLTKPLALGSLRGVLDEILLINSDH